MQTSRFPSPEFTRVRDFIAVDASHDRFAQWGTSTVVDENTGEPVIDRPLFDALHRAAGIAAQYPFGNAGVIHVYGYWFSTALTPYGYKRDRWVDGQLATALGQPASSFHLSGDAGSTPLERVTAAALPLLREPPMDAVGQADAQIDGLETRVVLVSAAASSPCALIYGIRLADDWQLVTTFPLTGETDAVIAAFLAEPQLRWNAVAPAKP